jgi:2-polyprenyl-3-methyl-5-hydroxy-6-metoxy-1,4-benzoquinol methylase
MMLGLRDTFEYLECAQCGCLQLATPPADWSRYYPSNYYSYAVPSEGPLKRLMKRARARHAMGRRSLLGALLNLKWGAPPFTKWIAPLGIRTDASILDVGSGSGHLLREMSNAGFTNLTGVDPYVSADIDVGPGARVFKKRLEEVEGRFDFVMMNLSFEHMEEPECILREAARLLPPGGIAMLRIPVAGNAAWREYGTDWVQLDPPRHVFIHSEESIRILAGRTSFVLREIRYDSTAFQFWGSEQYRRDIPLHDARSYAMNPKNSPFTKAEMKAFERRAADLNARREGDLACFYLVRA